MIRFIIKREARDASGMTTQEYKTLDVECQPLENILTSCGSSEYGYEYHKLIGAFVKRNEEEEK